VLPQIELVRGKVAVSSSDTVSVTPPVLTFSNTWHTA
jgi:hypothetical protein